MIPLVLGLAIVVDSGRVWAERTTLQNAVEVTAASAASAWIRTGSVCPSSTREYLSRDVGRVHHYRNESGRNTHGGCR